MSSWSQVRQAARRRHEQVAAALARETAEAPRWLDAWSLVNAAAELTGVEHEPVRRGDRRLDGAVAQYLPDWQCILYDRDVGRVAAALNLAHEYGHVWLGDNAATRCSSEDIDPERAGEPGASGVDRIAGYGPAELRERRANVFAREFLLPASEARRLYAAGMTATEIAHALGLPPSLVLHQIADAVLAPERDDEPDNDGDGDPLALDESQRAAATVDHGPLLVEAGPGTGKTRTLTARIVHLLTRGVLPERILALTFSNRAAEEMRDRVARVAPEAAARIWIGTFHAFALDLLHRFYDEAGLPPRFTLLDPPAALALLEDGLPELKLVEYRNLRAPVRPLREILGAIGRAQDEDADPARYQALADTMLERALALPPDDKDAADGLAAAKKAREVARVYAWYERRLRERGVVDFGGLICRAIALLRENADVRRRVQNDYQHVLVDEYQDVNRASGLLLRLVAGEGPGLWVVGDPRQAIYRFRGASPANIALFKQDFPGAQTKVLRRNYRSRPAVLDAVAGFAATMPATHEPFVPWQADRAAGGEGVIRIDAPDRPSEAAAIVAEIERLHEAGIAYRDQAVLARSHATLARIGATLERAGVPALYLGSLFERPEVKDMLALLQLLSGDGRALIRLAEFPDYNVPLADATALIAAAREAGRPFPDALDLADDLAELTPPGRDGLHRLREETRGLENIGPATALAQYLFIRGSYLTAPGGLTEPQRRLALYQLLRFAEEQERASDGSPRTAAGLLRYIRRLALFGDERDLRQLPARAAGLDGVRLLTVHASKGLEFAAVHLPELGTGLFPATRRWQQCPPPPGLIAGVDDPRAEHEAEEECLFFVALSRARDALRLSRPDRLEKSRRNASPFLERVDPYLSDRRAAPPVESEAETSEHTGPRPRPQQRYSAADLDLYLRCPRRYLYEKVLNLDDTDDETAYRRFHRVTRGVVRPVLNGRVRDREQALAQLEELWQAAGPHDDPFGPTLFDAARAIVDRSLDHAAAASALARLTYDLPLEHGTVSLRPDNVEDRDGVRRLQRLRTARLPSNEHDEPIYALYHLAAEQEQTRSGKPVRVEALALGDEPGDAIPILSTARKIESRVQKYDEAIQGIEAGQFPARPQEPRFCPSCPHYHICGAAGDAALPE